MKRRIDPARRLAGTVVVPGDKSISHRALILAALAEGVSRITNLSPGNDVVATARCLRALGVEIAVDDHDTVVHGVGLDGLRDPRTRLDCANSGTTMRLLTGVVAGAQLSAVLDGDSSLRRRPMRRILAPLRMMGAAIGASSRNGDEFPPLHGQRGRQLAGQDHQLEIASAQVKSCLLLAGLWAEGATRVVEPLPTRDHTERMLTAMGAPVTIAGDGARVIRRLTRPLRPLPSLRVPGDPSSAAFFVAAALLVPGARIRLEGVDLNPTRIGYLEVLKRMGAKIVIDQVGEGAGDPVGDLTVMSATELVATAIGPDEVAGMVDEIPILAVVASQAEGVTTIGGAGELRVKESDRLHAVAQGLTAMGAKIEERPDGLTIQGRSRLRRATIDCVSDHRIAMSFAIAGLIAEGGVELDGSQWVDVSYPGFFTQLKVLTGRRRSRM